VVPDVIMRAMFARGAFSKADAAAAGATLAAYAVGLIPFVLIRSAVATFYARKDTATPVKAALTGVAVNVALKIALVGSLAQIGLALRRRWARGSTCCWLSFRDTPRFLCVRPRGRAVAGEVRSPE
jgi:peptidoglycan biosynthesis protein MviN/MurJ (putative lipid II flippase)